MTITKSPFVSCISILDWIKNKYNIDFPAQFDTFLSTEFIKSHWKSRIGAWSFVSFFQIPERCARILACFSSIRLCESTQELFNGHSNSWMCTSASSNYIQFWITIIMIDENVILNNINDILKNLNAASTRWSQIAWIRLLLLSIWLAQSQNWAGKPKYHGFTMIIISIFQFVQI